MSQSRTGSAIAPRNTDTGSRLPGGAGGSLRDVFSIRCGAGDLLTVPANTKHWFDLGPEPRVCAIRIFTEQAGWIPQYTHSGIEQRDH